MTTPPRPLRADAQRNRRAIICAAGTVFATEGTEVTLEHIAEVAGVGVGTIYRRFPTLDELVHVVMEEKMRRYADRTEQAAAQALEQPWEAFRDYVRYILEQQAKDLAFTDLSAVPRGASDLFHEENQRAFRASLLLVERARAARAIRPDFHHSDFYMMLNANRGLLQGTQKVAPTAWRRFGDYMLQAFRHPGQAPLTPPAEAWERALEGEG